MNCRHCNQSLRHIFLDLGFAPPSNAYVVADNLHAPERYFPLKLHVCNHCWLVQTEDYASAGELFSDDYAYFSSTSQTWLDHATRYASMITTKLNLNRASHVIEVASNDGYLLKNFVDAGIPCLGIEPTASTATAAERLGVPVLRKFFGEELGKALASSGRQADLIIGNNVYAHVPDINDFTRGLQAALKPEGTISLEFPHLMRLIEHTQFDTVYHEHFSYLSLFTVERIFRTAGLRIWDVEQLPTHGGSLRIYGCQSGSARKATAAVNSILELENTRGLQTLSPYQDFQASANRVKDDMLDFLIQQKRVGKKVAAYGAAAKGSTLLNYAGVKPDLLPFICDAAAAKQGKFMPGSHIPIVHPSRLEESQLDFLIIFPWNIAAEIKQQNAALSRLGTKFVTAIPRLEIM